MVLPGYRIEEARCQLHGTPGCSTCRSVEDSLRRASERKEPIPTIIPPKPSLEQSRLQVERFEFVVPIVQRNFGITPQADTQPERKVISLRRFYQPLPVGSNPHWQLGGMSPVNVALFLTLPEVLYVDYEKNKDNPPITVYLSPTQAFDHPLWMGLTGVNPIFRNREDSVPPIGCEIVTMKQPIKIATESVPAKQRRGKLSVPPGLLIDLQDLETAQESITRRHAEGNLSKQEFETLRKSNYRERKKKETEIARYKNKWGKVTVPGTGRDSQTISIIPCPEGSTYYFREMNLVEQYIREAFGKGWQHDPELWEWYWSAFENRLITRAIEMKVFRRWPNPVAKAQYMSGWRPAEGEDYGEPVSDSSSARTDFESVFADPTTRDAARTYYKASDDGGTFDLTDYSEDLAYPAIRRVTPQSSDRKYGGELADSED